MTAPVHLSGFGWLGSVGAWTLERAGVPFTWDDPDAAVRAWPASTGCVYPSGDPYDAENHAAWGDWHGGAAPWAGRVAGVSEPADWWYSTKSAPHGLRGDPAEDLGRLRRASVPSYHVNVQAFVSDSRAAFADRRRAAPTAGSVRVVSHGFDPRRLGGYLWGWSARVRLVFKGPLSCPERRPALYLRVGRYVLHYAFPAPGGPYWYAGSSIVAQRTPRPLEPGRKLEAWFTHLRSACDGLLDVAACEGLTQGWRPRPAQAEAQAGPVWYGPELVFPAKGASGVRHAPDLAARFLQELARGPGR